MSTTTSVNIKWDARQGEFITTTTLESLEDYPAVPADSYNVTKSLSDGVYRVTYDDTGDANGSGGGGGGGGSSSSYSYEIHTTTSSEPLKSFWKFAPGGTWELSESDLRKIQDCEQGVKKWSDFLSSSSTGLKEYCRLMNRGIESVLKPSITLSITTVESSLPSMSDIGKIATISNAPTLPTGANWLLTGMNATAIADGRWKISKEYRASGQGGWESTLYGI
jgi:hypothetical protein